MAKTARNKMYRLTARKVYEPAVEAQGHVARAAVTLGQWDNRPDATDAMARYTNANPDLYAAGSARARLVITEV